ncbi:MAG: GAP family protein [Nanoarchaeota archaeon]|nr:GAP family protein [DPANN group archaeon]MBL7116920.1 GAP family protein [Nanoarchaeota archaeon]
MVTEIILPTIPVVITTAAIDSINPCAIGVLVLLVATLLGLSKNRHKMLVVGLIYITAVFLTYLAAGFGLLVFIQKLNISTQLSWIVGSLVIILGFIEIKDFWWYGKGISLQIPARRAKQIMKLIDNVSIPGAIVLGMFVAAVELPCTGGPYLAITTLLAKIGLSWNVFWLLVFYNFIFVLPLLIILGIVYFGAHPDRIKEWKDREKRWMRLFMGIVMVILGVLLILWAYGTISFGLG